MNTQSSILRAALVGLSLLGAGLLASPAIADPGRQLEQMSQALELSPEQRLEIEALIEAHRSRIKELGSSPETRREGRVERYALMQEILTVLNPEQRQQWSETRDQRRRLRQRHRAGNRLVQTLKEMDLSDAQRTSIEGLMAENRQRIRENHDVFRQELQEILTPEQWAAVERLHASPRHRGQRDG